VRTVFPALWPSPRGIWAILALCALLALAALFPPAFVAFGVACGVLAAFVVADLALGPRAAQLMLERSAPPRATAGVAAELTYVLTNRSPAALDLEVSEDAPEGVTFAAPLARVAAPAGVSTAFARTFVARERGAAVFASAYLRAHNAVGLIERRFSARAPAEARVLPDLRATAGYGALARRSTMLEAGLRRLRLRGVGSEFESLREYEPGDAYRSIDWKATARRGQPMVTQYDVERSQNVVLALDAGRLMTPRIGALRKFDYALTAALSTARVAQMAGDNVGVSAFAARTLRSVAPARGAAGFDALVRAVYDVQPRLEEPDYERAIAELAQTNTKRSLIVLFTDLFDPSAASVLLASLRVLVPRHLVLCALMNDAAIGAALNEAPRTAHDAFRSAVAMQLEDERAAAVATLRARGIIVVDVPAQRLTTALLDAYLDVKARAAL
jgi:uncharacterized protein (DUF58 family)